MGKKSNRQVAFLFQEAGGLPTATVGGKAESLIRLTQCGAPVPPGFFLTTGVCRAFHEHGVFPTRLAWQINRCLTTLEQQTGKRFGDSTHPLLVSVRSGAPVSMPGMMDTILNLGLTESSLPALRAQGGDEFAETIWRTLNEQFERLVGRKLPNDPREQLERAIETVCHSWNTVRAVEYRKHHGVPEYLGTAITVQEMVFGNLDQFSGTGVVFSQNVTDGTDELYGEFLPEAQGESLVGGRVTPHPISYFRDVYPELYTELSDWAKRLEADYGDVVEIEFTVQSGKLFLLQVRRAKPSPLASAVFAVRRVWSKKATKAEVLANLTDSQVNALRRGTFDPLSLPHARIFGRGLPVSPGAAVGYIAFSTEDAKWLVAKGRKVILVREETSPDDLPGMLLASGIVTLRGGATSHAAVVARSLGIPAVVGVESLEISTSNLLMRKDIALISKADQLSIDGVTGRVYIGEIQVRSAIQRKEVNLLLKWRGELSPHRELNYDLYHSRLNANLMLRDFYLLDAMAASSVGTKFEHEVNVLRDTVNADIALAFATYLTIAASGEMRYFAPDHCAKCARFKPFIEEYGLTHSGRQDAEKKTIAQLRESSLETQIEFLRSCVEGFKMCCFSGNRGGNIGGFRWSQIAEAALGYLTGELSIPIFVDRVFDLRHNGGRLFNKCSMFSDLTNEDSLQRQLDFKRRTTTLEKLHNGFLEMAGGMALLNLNYVYSPVVVNFLQKGNGTLWLRT